MRHHRVHVSLALTLGAVLLGMAVLPDPAGAATTQVVDTEDLPTSTGADVADADTAVDVVDGQGDDVDDDDDAARRATRLAVGMVVAAAAIGGLLLLSGR
ncbi:MAG: hypothetical protein RIB98_02700 [Acidimicrobiales bacterium]